MLCGVSADGVVQGAVRGGHDRGHACTILEDRRVGAPDDGHAFALAGLRRYAGVTTLDRGRFHG